MVDGQMPIHLQSNQEDAEESSESEDEEVQSPQKNKRSKQFVQYMYFKYSVYKFLEQPQGYFILYHMFVFLLIVVSFVLSVFLTISTYEKDQDLLQGAAIFEVCILVVFISECSLRLWSCNSVIRFRGCRGMIRFVFNFYMLVDILTIAATLGAVIPYFLTQGDPSSDSGVFELAMVRVTRFVQIFRILRLDRQRGDFNKMGRLIFRHKRELITSYYIGIMVLIFSAFGVYLIENTAGGEGALITNLADSLYWAIITVTMVGYGDLSPTYWASKLLTCIFALAGTALFAIPVGIISSGFALEVAKEKRKQLEKQIRLPAARFIQRWYRTCKLSRYHRQDRFVIENSGGVDVNKRPTMPGGRKFSSYYIQNDRTCRRPPVTRETNKMEMFAVRDKATHYAIYFFFVLKEAAAMSKFKRAKKPFISLEDVIAQVATSKLQIMTKLNAVEADVRLREGVKGKLDGMLKTIQRLETIGCQIIEEHDHGMAKGSDSYLMGQSARQMPHKMEIPPCAAAPSPHDSLIDRQLSYIEEIATPPSSPNSVTVTADVNMNAFPDVVNT